MRYCLWIALLATATAHAELPSPRLDRIFPAGASVGSTVEVEIQGADLEGAKRLIADHPGIVATFVSDRKFKITIGKDVPEGTRDIRVLGPWGLSSPRIFTVSKGLAEVLKSKDIHELAKAQDIAINTAVSGLTDGNRQDFYRLKGQAGKRWVVEVRAQSIDSALDATLTITNAAGKTLAFSSDHDGRDPLLAFTPPADGDYGIVVADLAYAGGLPYRLIVTDRPRIENVFPRALQAGKPVELTALGWNLGPSAKRAPAAIDTVALDEYRETVTPPADIVTRGLYRFIDHPTAHSVLPTAATGALTGYQVRLSPGGIPANPVPVLVTDQAVTLEQEPNNDPAKGQKIALPAVVSGRFDQERDADWYEFTPPSDGEYMVDVSTSGITPSLTAIDVDAYDLQIEVYQFSSNPNRASNVLRGQTSVDFVEIIGQQFVMSKVNIDGNEFVVIHFTDSTYSRAWNEIEVIGLNKLGMTEVIYAIKGEGMQMKTDGHGLYFTQYQYLEDEPMCCASFTRIIRLTNSQEGWLESVKVMNTAEADTYLSTLSDLQLIDTWLPSGTIQGFEE